MHTESQKRRRHGRLNGLIGRTSVLNDDGMAAFGVLGIFMASKVIDSLSKDSRDLTKPTKMIADQENNFWKENL